MIQQVVRLEVQSGHNKATFSEVGRLMSILGHTGMYYCVNAVARSRGCQAGAASNSCNRSQKKA